MGNSSWDGKLSCVQYSTWYLTLPAIMWMIQGNGLESNCWVGKTFAELVCKVETNFGLANRFMSILYQFKIHWNPHQKYQTWILFHEMVFEFVEPDVTKLRRVQPVWNDYQFLKSHESKSPSHLFILLLCDAKFE